MSEFDDEVKDLVIADRNPDKAEPHKQRIIAKAVHKQHNLPQCGYIEFDTTTGQFSDIILKEPDVNNGYHGPQVSNTHPDL